MFCEERAKYGRAKYFDAKLIETVVRPCDHREQNAMWLVAIAKSVFKNSFFIKLSLFLIFIKGGKSVFGKKAQITK